MRPVGRALDGGWVALGRRAVALTLIASLLSGGPAFRRVSAQQAPLSPATEPDVDPLSVLEATQKALARIPRADWRVEDRAAGLPSGVDAAFALVRDEIGFEPYAGVLRGPQGTYASRAGNAVDRALLLAALLNLTGTATRFVVGTLEAVSRDRLLARAFEMPLPRPAPGGVAGSLHARVFARATRDYGRIRVALGAQLPPVVEPARVTVLADMDPHVWVQASTGSGWIDLDPSFVEARPGQRFATPRQTVEQLPDDLFQRVTIRVVAEHLTAGTLTPRTLLSVSRRAADLNHAQVALAHTQAQGTSSLGGALGRAFGRRAEEWTPMLWIAGEFVSGTRIDVAAPAFVGEWLEIELAWPGGRTEVTRRPLADRGNAAWRATAPLRQDGLASLAHDDIGAVDLQAVHNLCFSGSQHDLAGHLEALEDLLVDAETRTQGLAAPPADDVAYQLWPFVLHNFSAMLWTDHVAIPLLNDVPGVRLYPDGLRVAVFSSGPSGRNDVRIATDWRRDQLRGLAREGAESVLAEKKLRFGVLQGALEHEFMHEMAMAWNGSADGIVSTSARLARGRLATVTGPSIATTAGAASANVRRALELQAVVVTIPAELDALDAWWRIDARTGDTHAVAGPDLHNGVLDLIGKGAKQMNPMASPKAYDARDALARQRDFARLMAEKGRREAAAKAAADPGRLSRLAKGYEAQPRGAGPGRLRGGGGGGAEYTVLLVAVHLASSMARWALSAWLEAKLYEQITAVAGWIADGGFRRAVGR